MSDGFPDEAKAFACARRRDFNHPIILNAFNAVTSYCFANDHEKDLRYKFKHAYKLAVEEFRLNPKDGWLQLEQFKEEKARALPQPTYVSKHLTEGEKIGWRDRFAQIQKRAEEDRKNLTQVEHPTFGSDEEDRRNRYLTSLTETEAMTLPYKDMYDRIRILRQQEGMRRCSN